MLSKSKIQFVRQLSQKKFRDETKHFVAEGTKTVSDLAKTYSCEVVFATQKWLNMNPAFSAHEKIEVTETELDKISNQSAPQGVLGVFLQPMHENSDIRPEKDIILALDDIQDPGNMGTIIRIADWFGIQTIVFSPGCADPYSPKTVQATMGALSNVRMIKKDLADFLKSQSYKTPIYGTFLKGENIFEKELTSSGIIIVGNEGKGISANIERMVTDRLFIPEYKKGETKAESLNVAVATGIICAEFRRRPFNQHK